MHRQQKGLVILNLDGFFVVSMETILNKKLSTIRCLNVQVTELMGYQIWGESVTHILLFLSSQLTAGTINKTQMIHHQ